MQHTTCWECPIMLETFICVVNMKNLGSPFALPFVLTLQQFIMAYRLRKEQLTYEISIDLLQPKMSPLLSFSVM